MTATELARKLRIASGARALIMNAPSGYSALLGALPEGVAVSDSPAGEHDFVHLFVKDSTELEALGPAAISAAKGDAVFWVSYPKRSAKTGTDLSRDSAWEILQQAGLRPVSQVSIDDTWSALRFRPRDRVGK